MPAVYMLVPGSMIALLWFNSIFPPPLVDEWYTDPDGNEKWIQVTAVEDYNVFANLFVISSSLALGLILGFVMVQFLYQLGTRSYKNLKLLGLKLRTWSVALCYAKRLLVKKKEYYLFCSRLIYFS